MTVEIDRLDTNVDVVQSASPSQSSSGVLSPASTVGAMNAEQLKEMLRPLVMQILAEELGDYTSLRG